MSARGCSSPCAHEATRATTRRGPWSGWSCILNLARTSDDIAHGIILQMREAAWRDEPQMQSFVEYVHSEMLTRFNQAAPLDGRDCAHSPAHRGGQGDIAKKAVGIPPPPAPSLSWSRGMLAWGATPATPGHIGSHKLAVQCDGSFRRQTLALPAEPYDRTPVQSLALDRPFRTLTSIDLPWHGRRCLLRFSAGEAQAKSPGEIVAAQLPPISLLQAAAWRRAWPARYISRLLCLAIRVESCFGARTEQDAG